MYRSTRVNSGGIPPQWNPFGESAFGSPWNENRTDVLTIHKDAFRAIMAELDQVRWGGKGSIVITGEPGSGKTHLLGRIRRKIGKDVSYIYVRCNASAVTLWQHVRASIAGDLLKQEDGEFSRLQLILRQSPDRLDKLSGRGLHRVLKCYSEGRHVHAAAAWLRGEALPPSDLDALGFKTTQEPDEDDRSREDEARIVVNGLLDFLFPDPVVLCFDQVEALETYRGDEQGFHAMSTLISEIVDTHSHLLLVSCIVSAFEDLFDRLPNQANRQRWLQGKVTLRPIEWREALALVRERLDSAPDLVPLRLQHPEDPLYPLNQEDLKPLFEQTGLCLPRTLIQRCKLLFQNVFWDERDETDNEQTPRLSRQDFLQEVYTKNVSEARGVIARLGGDKTLNESLPWLLQNSNYTPLGPDPERSQYANLAFRGEAGEFAVSLCYCRGNELTGRLKKIDRFWKPEKTKLYIVRDASVKPGARGAELLTALRERGANEVLPLPEALAALQAIRDMIASARAGDLRQDGEMISDPNVTEWALSNIPAQVEQLREALSSLPSAGPADSTLPKLVALLKDRKVIAAAAAASELALSVEEVSACASRHPMRFGVLAGPPMVLFQAIEGPSLEASHASTRSA
jgi:hypothetical protein